MSILEKIDELRKERGWSINYLAMEAMLTQSTLNNLYNRNTEPKISTLRAICNAFHITLAQFFELCDGTDNDNEHSDKSIKSEINDIVAHLSQEQQSALLAFLKTIY
jgi:transcriptional regulator with XRE-family HTH domain